RAPSPRQESLPAALRRADRAAAAPVLPGEGGPRAGLLPRRTRPGLRPHRQRRRIEGLLRGLEGQDLGVLRGVEVLEHLNTADAPNLLEALAGGEPEARLTREAREALGRLSRRAPSR